MGRGYVCFCFLHKGRNSSAVFWGGAKSSVFGNGFPGWLLVSGPFGLGVSVLLGRAWREQLSETLKHLPPGWEGKMNAC